MTGSVARAIGCELSFKADMGTTVSFFLNEIEDGDVVCLREARIPMVSKLFGEGGDAT